MLTIAAMALGVPALFLIVATISILYLLFTKAVPPAWPALVLGVILLVLSVLYVVGVGG